LTAKDIVEIGKRMYEKGYIIAHDGNISVFRGNTVYITPANVSKGLMFEDQIVEMTLDGEILNAAKPSSEYKMHLEIYRNNKDIHAVVHTHPLYATTFACMGLPLKSEILAEAKYQLGDILLAPFAEPGTTEAAESVVPFCKTYNGVLLEKHGLVTWGANLTEAYFRTEIAEFLAKITYNMDRLKAGRDDYIYE
jgi:L-fuculose-phosphate aldolase